MKYFVHESSYVDDEVVIGEGTKVWYFCHLQKGAKIGKACSIGQNVNVSNKVIIGDNVKIQNNVSLYDGIIIEDDVFCGPSCVFTNDLFPRASSECGWECKQTLIKKGASIGANATVVCGNTIGEYATVGAGAVITKDVRPHALMVGVPAKQIGWVCQCGTKLKKMKETFLCEKCGNSYRLENETLTD